MQLCISLTSLDLMVDFSGLDRSSEHLVRVRPANYCKYLNVQVVHKEKKLKWIAELLQLYRPRQPSCTALQQIRQALTVQCKA